MVGMNKTKEKSRGLLLDVLKSVIGPLFVFIGMTDSIGKVIEFFKKSNVIDSDFTFNTNPINYVLIFIATLIPAIFIVYYKRFENDYGAIVKQKEYLLDFIRKTFLKVLKVEFEIQDDGFDLDIRIFTRRKQRFYLLKNFIEKILKHKIILTKQEFIECELKGFAKTRRNNLIYNVSSSKPQGIVGICYNKSDKDICYVNKFNARDEKYNLNPFQKFAMRSVKFWVCYKIYSENTDEVNAIISFEMNKPIEVGDHAKFVELIFESFIDELFGHIPYLIE